MMDASVSSAARSLRKGYFAPLSSLTLFDATLAATQTLAPALAIQKMFLRQDNGIFHSHSLCYMSSGLHVFSIQVSWNSKAGGPVPGVCI